MLTYSVLILFGVGLVAGLILAVASKVFYVEEDPRVEAVLDVLPGANCGGCGYAGCEGYASAVVADPNVPASLCVAGSADTTIAVGELTGKAVSEADPLVAVRRCEKIEGEVVQRFEYQGLPSCASAASLGSGLGIDACPYSCLGLGDCVKVCPFGALGLKDMLVRVDTSICTGCGKCVNACPRGLLELTPKRARVMVFCSTQKKAKEVTDVCKVGCISCTLCIKKCPAKAVSLQDNIIKIDHATCLAYGDSCEKACVSACKRNIFKSLYSLEDYAKVLEDAQKAQEAKENQETDVKTEESEEEKKAKKAAAIEAAKAKAAAKAAERAAASPTDENVEVKSEQ